MHWVACLFTSVDYGAAVDAPTAVLANTARAVADLRAQAAAAEPGAEWHAAKINSVRFRVPWAHTVAVLEREAGREVVVYEHDEAAA